MPADVRYHMTMMPSSCLVHRDLLHFVSAFMNYKARKLLEEQLGGVFKKPAGDAVIACFPMVMDCPEIVENLAMIWREDVDQAMRTAKAEMDVNWIMRRMKDYICRLYAILYSEDFKANRIRGSTYSACADRKLYEDRERLIHSALRYGQQTTKAKKETIEAPSEMTTFQPFNISEMEFEIWDNTKSKKDQFLLRMDERKSKRAPGRV